MFCGLCRRLAQRALAVAHEQLLDPLKMGRLVAALFYKALPSVPIARAKAANRVLAHLLDISIRSFHQCEQSTFGVLPALSQRRFPLSSGQLFTSPLALFTGHELPSGRV
jgi:hypothetical protein